jgi:hypothetical protein
MRENFKLRNTEWEFHYKYAVFHVIIQACSVLFAFGKKMCQASSRLSVHLCLHETTQLPQNRFLQNFILKIVNTLHFWSKVTKEMTLYMKTYIHL